MFQRTFENRTMWLLVGLVAGLSLASVWPHEPALAATTDRSDKFAIFTAPVGIGEVVEGVFILDFLTGRLSGAVLNSRNGLFTHRYFQNVAQDFQVNPGLEAQYAVVAGQATFPNRGRVRMAESAIYVAEMTTGKIICYTYQYPGRPNQVTPLVKIGEFSFRQAAM